MVKDIEEILTKSTVRARALHLVALDGINWEKIRATEGQDKADQLLEEFIKTTEEEIGSRKGVAVLDGNSLGGYGVDYGDLSCFRGKGEGRFDMNYKLLRQIWYGLNYVEVPEEVPGIPHEFLSTMNTFEILSLYRAFARLIEYGNIPTGKGKETISKDELKAMPAELIISKMVGYGCRHKALSTMRKRGCDYFPTKRGDLIKRIRPFNRELKDRFRRLLDNRRRTTKLTEERGEYPDFEDPCYYGIDARRGLLTIKGYFGRKKYTGAIAYFMERLYNRNTQQKA